MDDQVVTALGIDKMVRVVPGFLQEINDQVLMKLLAFGVVGSLEQRDQVGFETFDFSAVRLYFQKSLIQCLPWFQFFKGHRIKVQDSRGKIKFFGCTL